MKMQIRGIVSSYPENKQKIQIITRDENGENYRTFEYPQGKPLSRDQVILFLAEKIKIPSGDILIPSHLSQFFETEENKQKGQKNND